jgi:hypothetical protein
MKSAEISRDGSTLTVRVPLTFRKRGGRNRHAHDRRGDSRRREDQFVLCGSRPAADAAIAGDRRGDSGRAAAGGPTARGLAEAVSGRVEGAASRDLGPLSLTRSRASAVLCSVIRLANPMRAGRRGCSPATSFSRRVSPPSFRAALARYPLRSGSGEIRSKQQAPRPCGRVRKARTLCRRAPAPPLRAV